MNKILNKQNECAALQQLAAQRQTYRDAKHILGLQLLLLGPIAAILAIASILHPGLKPYTMLWALGVLLLDATFLTPRQKRPREVAARIQERFDCDVLSLKWDSTRVGAPEPHETVIRQAVRYQRIAQQMPPLQNWYSAAVGTLPLSWARLICQRTNCWWDAEQRRRYAAVIGGLLVGSFSMVFVVGVIAKLSVEDLLLIVIVPMAGTLRLAHQQWVENRDAANRLDNLRACAEKSWNAALNGSADYVLEAEARALQGEIFDGRKRNPLVFDFLFKKLRGEHENQANLGASQLVAEAARKLNKRSLAA